MVLLLLVSMVLFTQYFMCKPAHAIYASPIHAGCYIAAEGQCKIHVDPFTINVTSGANLVYFEIRANAHTVYQFKTDTSNPPTGNYSPSFVMQDFAATCGITYNINLIGRDSSSPNSYSLGNALDVICPATAP